MKEYVKQRDMSTEKGHKEPLYEGTLAFFFLRVVVLALVLFPRSLNSVKRSEEMSLTAKRRGDTTLTVKQLFVVSMIVLFIHSSS